MSDAATADAELAAISVILRELERFPPAGRYRVLDYVWRRCLQPQKDEGGPSTVVKRRQQRMATPPPIVPAQQQQGGAGSKLTPELIKAVLRADKHRTAREVADELGLRPHTVWQIRREYGVQKVRRGRPSKPLTPRGAIN
jgi:hypothetical protein